jgi:hypothetical protein
MQERSYVLLPRLLKSPRVVTVRKTSNAGPVTVEESTGVLVFLVFFLTLCAWLSWRWWVRPFREGGREALRLAI